jgi:Ni/Fe-hydrogenase 1 B-type cytochrome subunit
MNPAEKSPALAVECEVERVYVWDAVVRVTHWVIFLSVFVLSITGIYIGRPFYIPSGPTSQQLVMANMKTVHFYFAIIFTLAVGLRVLWWFAGSYYSNWREFLPTTRRRRRDLVRMFKFYTFFRKHPPLNVGHNPLAGAAYLAVFGLYAVMIFTGLALYSVDAGLAYGGYMREIGGWFLPLFGGPQTARWIHHIAMWFLLGFFAHHIWSVILMARVEGFGFIDSLISGYKFLPYGFEDRLKEDD